MEDTVSAHPSPERLGELLRGHLDGPEAVAIEEHLLRCASCCAMLQGSGEQDDSFVRRRREADARAGTQSLDSTDRCGFLPISGSR